MITELLDQEGRKDFPFLGGVLLPWAGIASYRCHKVSTITWPQKCTHCLIDRFGIVFQVSHDKLILLTWMHKWRRHLAYIYLLGQDINDLSSSNRQCSTLSADVLSGWLCMTFYSYITAGATPTFQSQIWMLSAHERKNPDEWLQGGGIRPVSWVGQGHEWVCVRSKLILEHKVASKYCKR